MMQRWDDLTPEEQARYENREKLLEQLATATQRAEAAEAALALATGTTPGKTTGVWVPLDKWELQLAKLTEIEERIKALLVDVERYGADQWRNGNAGKDPQEFAEWRKEQE